VRPKRDHEIRYKMFIVPAGNYIVTYRLNYLNVIIIIIIIITIARVEFRHQKFEVLNNNNLYIYIRHIKTTLRNACLSFNGAYTRIFAIVTRQAS